MIRPANAAGRRRRPDASPPSSRSRGRRDSSRGDARDELWRKFLRTRWKKHRNLLIEVYIPLVRSVAEQVAAHLPRSVDPEDLISVGIFGLLQSVENFDPDRGTKFETYCRARIRGAMIDELRSQDLLSRDARERANLVGAAVQTLRQSLGREPSRSELLEETGLTARELEFGLQASTTQAVVSLDSVDGASLEEAGVFEDLLDAEMEPPDLAHQKDLLLLIWDCLTDLERDILLLRYREGQTLRDIGQALKLSESRVCQMHAGLLERLQRRLAAEA